VGTLFRHLDFSLFHKVATQVPGVTLVLVGRIAGSQREMDELLGLGNVVHIPAVERHRVPEFISRFDVCLVPFKSDDVSKNVSPLKAYEYLAMGKPVVSVAMPALAADPVARDVTFAESADDFVVAVGAALDSSAPGMVRVPSGIAQAAWEGRYSTVSSAVRRAIPDFDDSGRS
jgi:glycosyltransferase involved in cell wall biosynthesis